MHTDITETRDKNVGVEQQIILYYKGPYKHRTEPSSHLAQQPNIYDLQTITYNYLLVQSTDMTLCGQPNL